ncbi:MAG: hypothetical protein ACOYUZ_02325 [Patescibacteria group bacterium]
MNLDEWRFNTRMAWDNPWLRWVSIATITLLIGVSLISGIKLFSATMPSGVVVTHYTVYLGIDQVKPVYWILAFIIVPILIISATILLGLSFYRNDHIAAYGLIILSLVSTITWSVLMYYLIKINI